MNLLIKSVKIVDPNSDYKNKICDILIENGEISQIKNAIPAKGHNVYDAKGTCMSPGWFDMNVNIGDPGFETKEDFKSGAAAAVAGGFTGLAMMPNTMPPIHSKSEVDYVKSRTAHLMVDIFPIGCVSHLRKSENLAEMFDMHQAGAVAFSDGNRPINDAGLMMRGQLYAKGFNGLVISYAEDRTIAGDAKMNEGVASTLLGMKGIPNIAEELMVARDLFLTEYNQSPLHFTTVSTAGTVALIKAARKNGLKVTADVAAHHLLLDDTILEGFDTNYKVKPPLRSKADVKALKEALKDGVIDAVCSQHTPHEVEFKAVEFEIAKYGISALETAFAVLNMACEKMLSVEQMIEKLAIKPREILGIGVPSINKGQKANLTIFDPSLEWELKSNNMLSKGKNSPFVGKMLKGKALAVYNKLQFTINK